MARLRQPDPSNHTPKDVESKHQRTKTQFYHSVDPAIFREYHPLTLKQLYLYY